MNKKIIALLILVVIILLFGFIGYNEWSNSTVKVGSTEFSLPEGYYKGALNEFGAVNITNGNSSIFIYEYEGNDTLKYISHYTTSPSQKNLNISIVNYTVGDVVVYKTDNKDSPYKIHNWFIKNNKTYDVYTWDGNKDLDSVVTNIIKS